MIYHFAGCVLDVPLRRLTRDGAARHVEPQVFDLLAFLIEHRGRVVDRDDLIARVWKGRIVSDATIASRINAARTAVGDDGRSQSIIATLPRQGFRFVAEVAEEGGGLGRPRVAVLPFRTADETDRHLAAGLADQLAGTLGQAGWFDVCDTAASFAPGLAGCPPGEIAIRLGAGYLVTGTLQAAGEDLRLTVRLSDPAEGRQVWTETLAGTRAGIFALHDRLSSGVLGQIEPRLRRMELQRGADRHGNATAFDHYLRAADLLRPMDLPAMRAARDALDRAIAAHPDYPAARAMSAWIATLLLPHGQRVDEARERERARGAVAAGAFDAEALAMGGYALGFFARDPALGLGFVHRASALNPSSARAEDHAGWLCLYAGWPAEALGHFDRALSLSPVDEFSFRMRTGRAFANLFLRRFDAAAADGRRAHAVAPAYTVCHRVLIAALAQLGEMSEATRVLKRLAAEAPGVTLKSYARATRFEGVSDRNILFGGLEKAGLR